MSYYPVPEDVMEDSSVLIEWAHRGLAAALRAPRRTRRSKDSRAGGRNSTGADEDGRG